MYMASNLLNNNRTKHMDLVYHLIRDLVNKGIIHLGYLRFEHNIGHHDPSFETTEAQLSSNMFM